MSARLLYSFAGYYLTLALFGACGLLLGAFAVIAGAVLPPTERTQRFFQRAIHRHFAAFVAWISFTRLFQVRYHGWENLARGRGGLVIAANHPSLVDVTCLLARVPEAICIFNRSIRRNPVLSASARRAGYLANDGGHQLVRRAIRQLSAGHTLVIFPEGTRTPPGLGALPLKPGFVLMARRADVPIQLVHLSCTRPVLAKGRPWWKLPPLPAAADVVLGPCLRISPMASTGEVTRWIEGWLKEPHSSQAPTCAPAAGVVLCSTPPLQ